LGGKNNVGGGGTVEEEEGGGVYSIYEEAEEAVHLNRWWCVCVDG